VPLHRQGQPDKFVRELIELVAFTLLVLAA
jgi:hypothetical protein